MRTRSQAAREREGSDNVQEENEPREMEASDGGEDDIDSFRHLIEEDEDDEDVAEDEEETGDDDEAEDVAPSSFLRWLIGGRGMGR